KSALVINPGWLRPIIDDKLVFSMEVGSRLTTTSHPETKLLSEIVHTGFPASPSGYYIVKPRWGWSSIGVERLSRSQVLHITTESDADAEEPPEDQLLVQPWIEPATL